MKLLLDENLSDRIIHRIIDLYPDSEHVKTLGLTNTDDAVIWEYAKADSFVIGRLEQQASRLSNQQYTISWICFKQLHDKSICRYLGMTPDGERST